MAKQDNSKAKRIARHKRVRRRVKGIANRPRLAIFRSLNHIYAQVIDDRQGITLVAASSNESEVRDQREGKSKMAVSEIVGSLIASRAQAKGVSSVVFDRGGNKYHGRVKAVANAAREGGLVF